MTESRLKDSNYQAFLGYVNEVFSNDITASIDKRRPNSIFLADFFIEKQSEIKTDIDVVKKHKALKKLAQDAVKFYNNEI